MSESKDIPDECTICYHKYTVMKYKKMTCESCKNSCCKECWYAWLKIKIDNPTCQFPNCNAKILNESIKLNVRQYLKKKDGDFTLTQKDYNYGVFLHEYKDFVERNLSALNAIMLIKQTFDHIHSSAKIYKMYNLVACRTHITFISDDCPIEHLTDFITKYMRAIKEPDFEFTDSNESTDNNELTNLVIKIYGENIAKLINTSNPHFLNNCKNFIDWIRTDIIDGTIRNINLEKLERKLNDWSMVNIPYVENGGSIEEQNTRITMKCPMQNCNNYMQNYRCKLCKCRVCAKCNAVVEEKTEHTCKQEDLDTVEFIKKSSRQCPNKDCDQTISKIDGCDVMFCTKCHTSFNYKTGKVIKDHASRHNPHYFEYLRKRGKELPRQDEINPCQQDFMENLEYDASGNSYSRKANDLFCIYTELEHKLDHYISDKELLKQCYNGDSAKKLNMSLYETFSLKYLTDVIASFITNTRSNLNKLKVSMNELMITHYFNRKNDDEYLSDLKDRIDVNYNNQKNLQTFLEFFEGYGLILFSHLQYLTDISKIKEFFSLVKDFQQKCNAYKKAMPFGRSTCIKSFKWFTSYNIDSIKVMTRLDFVHDNLLNLRDEEDHIRRVKINLAYNGRRYNEHW